MKNEIKKIGIDSVIKIITEEVPGERVVIQKRFLSAIRGEDLNLLNVDSFVSGLHLALSLIENEKRITKGESAVYSEPVLVVPAESAYDDDFPDLIINAVNNFNRLIVCFNQQVSLFGYACSATPKGTATKNFSADNVNKGYPFPEKPLCRILAAAGADYVAQTSTFSEIDYRSKLHKALNLKGFRFLNVLTPSPFWGYSPANEEAIGNLAQSTGHFPHFEIEKGSLSVNLKSSKLRSLTEYFGLQKRFRHLTLPANRKLLDEIQHSVHKNWEQLGR